MKISLQRYLQTALASSRYHKNVRSYIDQTAISNGQTLTTAFNNLYLKQYILFSSHYVFETIVYTPVCF